jgi:DNA/RNA endonuclease YhcR with UshA esterase domain
MFRAGTLICVQGIVSTYRGVAQIEVGLWDPQDRLLSF